MEKMKIQKIGHFSEAHLIPMNRRTGTVHFNNRMTKEFVTAWNGNSFQGPLAKSRNFGGGILNETNIGSQSIHE
jgi:hypothetical protein